MIQVNHSKNPIHDNLCRCRACKPAPVETRSYVESDGPSGAVRWIVLTYIIYMAALALIALLVLS